MPSAEQWSARRCLNRACVRVALALCLLGPLASPAPAAAEATKELLIAALFDSRLASPDLDANHDKILSVADVLLLPADTRTPTPRVPPTSTSTRTAESTRTRTPTEPPAATATRRPSLTATQSPHPPTETETATPTVTPTIPTPTPEGLIFAGNIAELVPHATGDVLVYLLTTATQMNTQTTTVISSDGGNFVADLSQPGLHEQQTYRDDGNVLSYLSKLDLVRNARTTCTPQIVRLVTPMWMGDFSRTESRCEVRLLPSGAFGGAFDDVETFEPIDVRESVTVPAGTYSPVIHVRQTSSVGEEVNEVDIFPGIGIIRRSTQSIVGMRVYELVDGTVNGQSVKR